MQPTSTASTGQVIQAFLMLISLVLGQSCQTMKT
jgi:hypothetical protein